MFFFLSVHLHVTFCLDLLQAIDEAAFSVAYANMCRCLIPVSNICLTNVTLFVKTRLNENIVVRFFHFNAFSNIENALGNIFIAF